MRRVVKNEHTGQSKQFGFVSFSDPSDFLKALREMNGKYVGSRPCKLSKSKWQDRSDKSKGNKPERNQKYPKPTKEIN